MIPKYNVVGILILIARTLVADYRVIRDIKGA